MPAIDELKKMLKETEEKIKDEMKNIDSDKVSEILNNVKSQISESAKNIFDNESEEIKEENNKEQTEEKEENKKEEQTEDIKDNESEKEKTITELVKEYIRLLGQSKKINSDLKQTRIELYGKVKGQINEIGSSVKQGMDNISSSLFDKASQAKEYVKNMTSNKEIEDYDLDDFDDDFFREYPSQEKFKMFNYNGKTFIEIKSSTMPESTEELLEKMRKNQKLIDEMMEKCKEINEKVTEKLQIADDKDISVSERLTILKQFVMEIGPKKESKVEINEPYTYIGTFATIMDYKTNKAYECIVDRDDIRAEYRLYYDSKNNELKLPIPTADKFEEEYEIIFPKLNKKTK